MNMFHGNTMRWLALLTAFALLLAAPQVGTRAQSADVPGSGVVATGIAVPGLVADVPKSFDDWLTELRTEARGKGYSEGLIEETLTGLTPLERVDAAIARM